MLCDLVKNAAVKYILNNWYGLQMQINTLNEVMYIYEIPKAHIIHDSAYSALLISQAGAVLMSSLRVVISKCMFSAWSHLLNCLYMGTEREKWLTNLITGPSYNITIWFNHFNWYMVPYIMQIYSLYSTYKSSTTTWSNNYALSDIQFCVMLKLYINQPVLYSTESLPVSQI